MVSRPVSRHLDVTGAKCFRDSTANPLASKSFLRITSDSVEVKRVDYVLLYNTLVDSLFANEAPYRVDSILDVPRVSKEYEALLPAARDFGCPATYFRIAQAASFFKKLELEIPQWRKAQDKEALAGWKSSEALCKEQNARLWHLRMHPISESTSVLETTVSKVREEIHSLLGEFPPDISRVSRFCKFGPGVSLTTKRDDLDPILKCVNPSALTSQADDVRWLFQHTPMGKVALTAFTGVEYRSFGGSLSRYEVDFAMKQVQWIDHEKYTTVPKSLATRRTIGVGGSLSTWIQQGYDGFIRQRLKEKWNINLADQLPNQRLARLGSLGDGDIPCTIDLTDASNRIAYGLIPMTFSRPWARLLNANRAKYTLMPDKSLWLNEKFSAMGNALTFSLQTVLYAAVVRSVCKDLGLREGRWRVYGDDIIVPKSCYDEVVARLKVLGFEPNPLKSFSEGNFRESCGADFLLGTNVRPCFIKEPIRTVADLYKYINMINLTAANAPISAGLYRSTLKVLLDQVPKEFLIFGEPTEVLDSYIWDSAFSGLPRRLLCKGFESDTLPSPQWALWRCMLTEHSEDSHCRLRKGRLEVTGLGQSVVTGMPVWSLNRSSKLFKPLPRGKDLMSPFFMLS